MPQEHPSPEAPDWRYAVACAELHKEQSGLPVHAACPDFSVKHLKRVLSLMRDPKVAPSLVEATLGPVCKLVGWYEHDTDTRFLLEALILGRADDESIRIRLDEKLVAPMMHLYRSWFFDVADRMDQHMWIENRILRPALYRAQEEASPHKRARLHTAYMWKALGYYSGYEKLELAVASGMIYDNPSAQFLRRYATSKSIRTVLAALDDQPRDEFGLQQHAQVHAWGSEEVRADREAGASNDEVMDRVTEALGFRLNPAQPSGKVEKIERIAVPTYTEKDLPDAR